MNQDQDREAAPEEVGNSRPTKDVLPVVAQNLRRLRTRKGYSLERLARASTVSRAMLSQIELAQSAPTINVLWKIASALSVPFSALLGGEGETPTSILRAQGAARLTSADGSFSSRPLFPFGQGPRRTEQGGPDVYNRIEERLMRAAYLFCDRNQVRTAKLLGVSRNIVRARLMQYGDIAGTPRTTLRPHADDARTRPGSDAHAFSGSSG
ncbi:MAG: hypothetical protein RLZZ450_4708 [Pseudomonadota bacterium]|jgi:transcriptional regulator with XRE-family HTH domain